MDEDDFALLRRQLQPCALPLEEHGHRTGLGDENWGLPKQGWMIAGFHPTQDVFAVLDNPGPTVLVGKGDSGIGRCVVCGERPDLGTDGVTLWLDPPCRYPDGIPFTMEIDVPSGFLAVANDLRRHFGEPDDDTEEFYVNTALGRVNTAKWYAERGLAHASVGNTCPSVCALSEERFTIAGAGWDETTGQSVDPPGTRVAGIITDLWWYSICDWDLLTRLNDGVPYEIDRWGMHRVPCRPGRYRFTHHVEEATFDHENYTTPTIYTDVERIGDCSCTDTSV